MKPVPRIGRLLDLGGLLIFLGGAATYAWAWTGFHDVPDYVPPADSGPWATVSLANGYWRLQKIGTGLMLAGVAVFILAWWVARRSTEKASVDPSGGSH